MYKFKYLGAALLTMLTCVNLTSCSDDNDDNKTPGIVKPGETRKLKTIYYKNGNSDEQRYQFNNPVWNGNRLISFCDSNDEEDRMFLSELETSITLNGNGYAIDASFGYTFTYNKSGQMTSWKGDPNWGNEYCNIYYTEDGDINRVQGSYSGSKSFEYTNATVTTPIDNKGGIMLMSEWGIMWDFEYYYWFGIYGKATRHLPVRAGQATYDWTLDNQGYPTTCVVKGLDYTGERTYHFEWE